MRVDLIEVSKILRGSENVDPEKFFQVVRDDGRRGQLELEQLEAMASSQWRREGPAGPATAGAPRG